MGRMQPLHRKVPIRLGHLIDEQTLDRIVYWRYTSQYHLFDFHFTRPAKGQRRFDLRCPACGKELMLRLDSVERTKWIKKRYLTTALTGSSVVAATVVLGGGVHVPLPETLEAVVFIAFLVTRRKGHWRASSPRLSGA